MAWLFYALKNLNPFAVIGADYTGLGHASNSALTLFDPMTNFGELTEQYLADRAAFLEAKIEPIWSTIRHRAARFIIRTL